MEKKKVIAGIAHLLNKNVVVKADDEEIQEVPMDSSEPEIEENDTPEGMEIPDIDMPMVLEDPFVAPEDMPSEEEMDKEIEEIQMDMENGDEGEQEEAPVMEDEDSHQLDEAASSFLDQAEIPKGGAQVKRIGSYDVMVLGPGVALNRAQVRYLLAEGLIHIAADADAGGQALVFPTGSRF